MCSTAREEVVMSRLRIGKSEKRSHRATARSLHGLSRIDTNLKITHFEVSDITCTNLKGKGAEKFHYPYAKLGSEAKHKVSKAYIAPETAIVGHRLTLRKHRKVIARAEWKGAFARG
jgi:hypothetical protein